MHRHEACLRCLAIAATTFAVTAAVAQPLPHHAPTPTLERPVTLPEATNVLPAARPDGTSADKAKLHWVQTRLA